ncbi:hypothetical protein [Paenibacillus sp.]|uniref:hypothetical protein n=1 Tax=Paenibacillus sp. TaxID=58172 RepID=UPI0006D2226E
MIFYYTELMAKPIEQIRTQMEDLQTARSSAAFGTASKSIRGQRRGMTGDKVTSFPGQAQDSTAFNMRTAQNDAVWRHAGGGS